MQNILNYMNKNCTDLNSKQDVLKYTEEHLSEIKKVAEDTVRENGFSYPITIETGNFQFPTKQYGDISFPAGYYDALKVKIGNSSGKNWWCVMFPPLCFIDTTNGIVPESSKEKLHESLLDENYMIISNSDKSNVAFKFKIVELFEKAGIITAKN